MNTQIIFKILIIPITIICACSTENATVKSFDAENNTIRVGALIGLSNHSNNLQELKKTILKIAEQDANEELARNGDLRTLQIVVEDTANNPSIAKDKVRELADNDIGIMIGIETSAEAAAIQTFMKRRNILGISTAASAPILNDDDLFFALVPSDNHQAKVLLNIFKNEGKTSLLNIHREDIYGIELFYELSIQAKDILGLDSIAELSYNVKQDDFQPLVNEAVSLINDSDEISNFPEKGAILFTSFSEVISLIKEIQKPSNEAVRKIDWYGTDSIISLTDFLESEAAAEAYAHNLKVTAPLIEPAFNTSFAALSKRIAETNPTAMSLDTDNAYLYDAIKLIVSTALKQPENNIDDITNKLTESAKNLQGATGPINFNVNGNQADWRYGLFRLNKDADGKFSWVLDKSFDYTMFP